MELWLVALIKHVGTVLSLSILFVCNMNCVNVTGIQSILQSIKSFHNLDNRFTQGESGQND